MRSGSYFRLICFAVAGWSSFLEWAPNKSLNELMNNGIDTLMIATAMMRDDDDDDDDD